MQTQSKAPIVEGTITVAGRLRNTKRLRALGLERPQQLLVLLLYGPIALTCRFPQTFNVSHMNFPARVFDHARDLKRMSDCGHAGAPHPQHLGEEFLRNGNSSLPERSRARSTVVSLPPE